MIRFYCLIIVLILLLFIILKISVKKESFINFFGLVQKGVITKENYVFPMERNDNDPCTHCNYNENIVKAHVNNSDLDNNSSIHKIHLVNPNNPCCLRTCINDFTPTKENSSNSDNFDPDKPMRWREGIINLNELESTEEKGSHYFYTSRCNECVRNFRPAIEKLYKGFEQCDA